MRVTCEQTAAGTDVYGTCRAPIEAEFKKNKIMQRVINIDVYEESPTLGFTFNFSQLRLTMKDSRGDYLQGHIKS